jgi:hypothetical protein
MWEELLFGHLQGKQESSFQALVYRLEVSPHVVYFHVIVASDIFVIFH